MTAPDFDRLTIGYKHRSLPSAPAGLFSYDDLNRLSSASGTVGPNQSQQTCVYVYNSMGNPSNKCGAGLLLAEFP